MLDRLMGVEHEYAVASRPRGALASLERPGNRSIYLALLEAVSERVTTRAAGGLWGWARERVFTQTGGSLYYEALPQAVEGGLVEAATPECRGPSETLRYARAWDRLLADAAAEASRRVGGPLVLRKNGRDAFGNVYGPQESYEVELASGWDAVAWRLGLAILVPLAFLAALVHLAVVLVAVVVGVLVALGALLAGGAVAVTLRLVGDPRTVVPSHWADAAVQGLAWMERASLTLWFGPLVLACSALLRGVAFRPYRRDATAFLVTRMLFSGAGTLHEDGTFELSEKASAIRGMMRWTFLSSDRGVLETGHLLKGLLGPMLLRPSHAFALFGTRQRLQIGLGDANLCDVAEYLKLATTALVLDLVEAGALEDAPRLADPIAALRTTSRRGTEAALVLEDGRVITALDVQRWYADRAAAWVAAQPAAPLEAHTLVQLWRRVLDALATDPESLVGEVDWITKRALLEEAASDLTWEARKKVDLRYHDLGEGYHAWLDGAGLVPRLLADDEIERATWEPPSDTPAAVRGALVRELDADTPARLDWQGARVNGRVIRFRPRGS